MFWVVAGFDKVKAVESIEVDKGRNRKGHLATDAYRNYTDKTRKCIWNLTPDSTLNVDVICIYLCESVCICGEYSFPDMILFPVKKVEVLHF